MKFLIGLLSYIRAAWRLLRRDRWVKRNCNGLHFVPIDNTRRAAIDRPTLCGLNIEHAGNATTQPSIVGCWRCALAIARDPTRWAPPRRAQWETYPGGSTVCRTCGGYIEYPPGCTCHKTLAQWAEQFMIKRASVLKFKRLRNADARAKIDL